MPLQVTHNNEIDQEQLNKDVQRIKELCAPFRLEGIKEIKFEKMLTMSIETTAHTAIPYQILVSLSQTFNAITENSKPNTQAQQTIDKNNNLRKEINTALDTLFQEKKEDTPKDIKETINNVFEKRNEEYLKTPAINKKDLDNLLTILEENITCLIDFNNTKSFDVALRPTKLFWNEISSANGGSKNRNLSINAMKELCDLVKKNRQIHDMMPDEKDTPTIKINGNNISRPNADYQIKILNN